MDRRRVMRAILVLLLSTFRSSLAVQKQSELVNTSWYTMLWYAMSHILLFVDNKKSEHNIILQVHGGFTFDPNVIGILAGFFISILILLAVGIYRGNRLPCEKNESAV